MKSRKNHKLVTVGPCLGCTIPAHLVKENNLKKGMPIEISYDAPTKTITIKILGEPILKPKKTVEAPAENKEAKEATTQ